MPLAGFIPTAAYQGAFMSIPNQMLNGQLMSGYSAGDFMGQQGQWDGSIGQQWDGGMGQQMMTQMAGVRPYQGMMERSQFAVLQRHHPVSQQQQPLRQQATPPPRAVQSTLREDQAHVRHAVSPNKQLREQIEILNADRDNMRSEIDDLKRQLQLANAQIRRLNEAGSSSPMPIPSTMAPKPTTPPARRANTPVSGAAEENIRGVGGSGSNLHYSPSGSYHGRFPSASRSNNSLATSRSGTVSGGVRPAWKTMNAHSSPLSFGANVRQISGPNGCITLGITRLAVGGPAEIAGLRTGDVLEECEFKTADEKGNTIVRRLSGCGFSKNALQKSLNNLGIGNQVTFFVNRDGERFEATVGLCPVDRCEWGAEGFEALDRSFTPTEEMLNESFVPVMPEFEGTETLDEKPRSQRWEQDWKLDFEKFLSFAVNEAKIHMGDEFASDEDAMSRFVEACQACEQQLTKEGHGDVRVPALWLNKDLILHFTGQQCEDNGLLY